MEKCHAWNVWMNKDVTKHLLELIMQKFILTKYMAKNMVELKDIIPNSMNERK